MTIGDRAERVIGSMVSANYFEAIGVRPVLGRGFEAGEDVGRNSHPITVISYQMRKDGRRLSPQEAATLAHDYDRSAELAKYMIFDLEEPWHWPHCAKKISLRREIATVKEVFNQATAADAKAKADASIAMAEGETANPRAHWLYKWRTPSRAACATASVRPIASSLSRS